MECSKTKIPDVLIINPDIYPDDRGYFFESWQQERYCRLGINANFVQDAITSSSRGVLRGIHFQNPHPQAKLISVLQGEIYDVVVDLRINSKTFGRSVGEKISSENKRQIFAPAGFGHGYCVLSETALISYKLSDFYHPESSHSVAWNDPRLAIQWPIKNPVVSKKDLEGFHLEEIPKELLYAQ